MGGRGRASRYGEPTPCPSQEGNCRRRCVTSVDQFEEVYSLCPDAEERQQFIANLLNAASGQSSHVAIILTLRSDFLGQTQSHPRLNHAIAASNVLVPVMSDAELRQAIAEPTRQAGHPLDDATIDLLIEQAKGREGALPLLQFALTKIWDGLAAGVSPAETLKQIGGIGGALAGEAQRLFDRLSDPDKAIARRAFLGLIQLGEGTRDTRRRISVTEIVAHGEDAAHVQDVLRCFADPRARLVTFSASVEGSETAEVTHEALLDHWNLLKTWIDSSRDDLRFHRHLAEDANYWAAQKKPDGLLWRPPDLDLLRQYHDRAGQEMTPLQVEFFRVSMRQATYGRWIKRGAIAALLIFAAVAGIAAYFAIQARNDALKKGQEALRLYHVSFVQSLVTSADQRYMHGEREQAALLARQAHFLNQVYHGNLDDQIRDVLRRTLALPEAETPELLEQVCQQARRNLTPEEWQGYVKNEQIAYQPCDGLPGAEGTANIVLCLRDKPMTTNEVQSLSLYVKADGYVGTFIDNRFELQHDGQVVVDKTTGLMWQQSGSPKELTYDDARKYIESLNQGEGFAGYTDWRLPTVEELLSLMEKETNAGGRFIDPRFDQTQSWIWSADLHQIKGEGSAESAWSVYFNFGVVDWYRLSHGDYVRGVRS
ncbi:WD-40 repeat protein [Candidatus Moduliflexus flocculans]|uniref:WD-40 repeat protein n=1 Tax=Candidatus Moduliflexus flocculans TaxID=1499966 RepID=A0A081BNL6_9BACT|nr:WD-40 repeat protein [Candidatus Moduliflexus flocculans]